jgi:hypothetical protein
MDIQGKLWESEPQLNPEAPGAADRERVWAALQDIINQPYLAEHHKPGPVRTTYEKYAPEAKALTNELDQITVRARQIRIRQQHIALAFRNELIAAFNTWVEKGTAA